ncbi:MULTISPECIES: TrbC family F-type conjugative pilus assembly protein [Paraburkholderia]|uniref:TrbC family F-type conjugative pilus assembly protein n=1 Tax=Paraburkholderia madseniana TaxID=2599607 RepID=A0AAP5ET97_9BURK|nr:MULTISPECIES: TrbC family F-type conjugative pilus assembly protein [Paraburkholderia]MCX4151040.1 TrbC family F-type conjugative pilus assembly protein [Paraburkholderia madseniana]MCX4176680.1 TrbC family F-type conjugative pilus assembly protein [Paraburkholderia madseniana]MDN7153972.1 type-F conjugative transfer system pilin assembly protein TrbC [Paraburkholderia sp. WS6]MDQ6412854.1 type-F conjugative transfer system pilin assembly protein TrbC [Paraburkholderia madseniana]MDQ6464671
MRTIAALLSVLLIPSIGHADESLLGTMTAKWNTYIFVSTRMPQRDVVALAREASAAKATIVLNGFGGSDDTLMSTERYATQINALCCGKRPAHWIIDPVIAQRYRVKSAPTFVVAHGESENAGEYSAVAGDMSLSQALKFFAQGSRHQAAREYATQTYSSAFGNSE